MDEKSYSNQDTPMQQDQGTPTQPNQGMQMQQDQGTPMQQNQGMPMWQNQGMPMWQNQGMPMWQNQGMPMWQNQGMPTQQVVNVNTNKSNGMGTAGFVLAILAFLFSWVPLLDFALWFLGALFSFIGVFNAPRGLAIAGLIISFIGFFVIIFVIGSAAEIFSMLHKFA